MGPIDIINYYYYELADSRMKEWFLLESIWSPILIVSIYSLVIFKLAPDYMKNRPAYELTTFIKCFNLFQIVANAYLVKNLSSCFPFLRTFECRPVVYSMDECSIRIMNATYIVMLLKIVDLIETVIYILRKKNNQITVLHVYHHISTVLIAMTFSRYFSVEIAMLFPIINCSVHVIMYSYYFLSSFKQKLIQRITVPFKRFLTIIQMVQLIILIIQVCFVFFESCPLPKSPFLIILLNVIFNFGFFLNFYKKTYIDSKSKKA